MSTAVEYGVQEVPVSMIRQNPKALRDVQRETEAYAQMVDSVKQHGIMNPIVLRPIMDEDTGETVFELIDGTQRWSAACDAGLETVPANVIDADLADMMRKQIIGNIHKIETKPVEYSKHLQKILALDPLLTQAQLAMQLNKTSTWIGQRLGLLNLEPRVADLVDEGQINLSNAYALAKLPPEEQLDFVDSAMTETPTEFGPKVYERKKELIKARREGRSAEEKKFVPIARFQKLGDIRNEVDSPAVGPVLVRQFNATTAEEGFLLGCKWCIRLDPNTVEEQRRIYEAKVKALEEKRERAKQERVSKRAEEASLKAARLKVEAEAIQKGEDPKAALEAFDKVHSKN